MSAATPMRSAHTYTAVVTKEPTCTEEGVKTFTCSECGKSYTEAIPTVAHRYEAVVTAPTCDKMGYTTYTCSACGDSYVADYVDAAGHDRENRPSRPPASATALSASPASTATTASSRRSPPLSAMIIRLS